MADLWVRNGSAELAIAGGVVAAAAPEGAPVLDATGLTVLPGVIDLQVNGVAGIDLTAEPDRLWEVGAALAAYGVTAWLPTVITSTPEAREQALATLAGGSSRGVAGCGPAGPALRGALHRARPQGRASRAVAARAGPRPGAGLVTRGGCRSW